MKKWLIGLLCVVLFVAIVLTVAVFNLGTIVKIAVNTYGPDITKTELRVDNADVAVFQGRAELKDFVLGNPDGFSSPHAMTVGSALVDIDETTLTQDTIIIDTIEIRQPVITYEIKGTTDNFRTMINNMKKPAEPASPGKPPEKGKAEKKDGKKVVIRDLILKDVTIKTAAAMAGGDIATTTIAEIHLKNVGEKQNGVQITQAAILVLNEIYGQVLSKDVLGQLKNQLKGLEDEFESVKDEVKSIGDQFKGLFDR